LDSNHKPSLLGTSQDVNPTNWDRVRKAILLEVESLNI
jgi:hypothetical protein